MPNPQFKFEILKCSWCHFIHILSNIYINSDCFRVKDHAIFWKTIWLEILKISHKVDFVWENHEFKNFPVNIYWWLIYCHWGQTWPRGCHQFVAGNMQFLIRKPWSFSLERFDQQSQFGTRDEIEENWPTGSKQLATNIGLPTSRQTTKK